MTRGRGVRFAIVVAIAALCGVAALATSMSERGAAAFPGANGKIAYSYGDAYSGSIWSANADGSSPTKLTSGSNDYNPTYSANGGRIAFERESGVAVMNADGSGLMQLLFGSSSSPFEPPEWEEEYKNPENPSETIPFVKIQTYTETWHSFNGPSFSSDGTQIAVRESSGKFAFTSVCAVEEDEDPECISGYGPGSFFYYEEECIGCAAHIIMVNSATGARTGEVTPASAGNRDYEPAYSSTGKLAFSRGSEGGSSIFVVNSPGAAPVQVTTGPEDYGPDFSPDGSRIAFSHGSHEIGLVGAGGGALTVLPVPNPPGVPYSYLESPVFSPDGSRIAFERTIYPSGGKSQRGIYTLAADGTGLTRILEGSAPSWQPVPLPPPPAAIPSKARAKKGKVRLDKKGKATIGTIVCGSSPCSLKVLTAKLRAGKKACPVKTTLAKKLAAGKSTKLKVKVSGKCLASLKKAGKGRLVAKVQVTDALGKKVLTLKSTLIPAKAKKGKKAKK
jgi:WD40 repeat protein